MYSKKFVSAVAAFCMATGAVADSCSSSTVTISAAADATSLASCKTVKGSVVIATSAPTTIDLSGDLTTIEGSLTAENNGQLVSLSSSSLTSIGDAFTLHNLTFLSTLSFTSLTSVGTIDWQSLTQLSQLTFGDTGVTSASSVIISDTFLSSLNGIDLDTVGTMNINNNHKLATISTGLRNLTQQLSLSANGQNLTVELPNLEWAANMTIANVTTFSAQSLAAINGSMRFDSNYFTEIIFPNLTSSGGDVSFVSNGYATNITAPKLKSTGGGFTVANNTALSKLNGFNDLASVGGAINIRGSFTEVSLDALDDVKGGFDVTSTEDIESSCDVFQKLSPNKGNGDIQGTYTCTSNNTLANNSTSSSGGDDGSSSSGSGNKKSGAFSISSSISTVITLATVGALVSAFM